MGLYDFTFYDLINRNAINFRNRPAWYEVDDGRTLTFSQYRDKVDHLACGIQKLGIEKGDRIGVLGKNSPGVFSPLRGSRSPGVRYAAYQLAPLSRGSGL